MLRDVPVKQIKAFEKEFLVFMDAKHRAELDILKSGKLNSKVTDVLEAVCKDLAAKYKA
jgi:F-type H+-transporting ATPase subunit alpha